ncbi:MAG: Trk system potassium transporter TrkA [Clostridiales bacterium]|nr:Trk system potassium transporter TrkA [Clostridiales bacterium]
MKSIFWPVLFQKKLGARHTIARVRNPEYSKQFNFMKSELGISLLINPDFTAALEISRMIQFPSAMHIESFAGGLIDLSEVKITDGSPIANMDVSHISSKYKNRLLICAVSRSSEVYIPNGDFVVKPGDEIYITSNHKYLGSIVRSINPSKRIKNVKKVMIIGGSRIAFYLTNLLRAQGKNIIIIEKDYSKCEELSEKLKGASIICADANEYDILREEGIENMDAVVTLSNLDEMNLLLSIFAASLNVPKNITKINNLRLKSLVPDSATDSIINPADTARDIITNYIRAKKHADSGEMKTLYRLIGGKIEAAEFVVDERTKNIGKTLGNINFKKDVLLASIIRKNKFIIPGGSDIIETGDRIVVVSKGRIIEKVNDIFE